MAFVSVWKFPGWGFLTGIFIFEIREWPQSFLFLPTRWSSAQKTGLMYQRAL